MRDWYSSWSSRSSSAVSVAIGSPGSGGESSLSEEVVARAASTNRSSTRSRSRFRSVR